ncbi:hypothetical protein AB4Y32_04790 [Paraburkholderia phymatum]|uniref:Uncharacterized protein n=1 Tax=Paraburkholderia phymatum TaxID=148447 RepID=A0ACC6TUN4_9BURK
MSQFWNKNALQKRRASKVVVSLATAEMLLDCACGSPDLSDRRRADWRSVVSVVPVLLPLQPFLARARSIAGTPPVPAPPPRSVARAAKVTFYAWYHHRTAEVMPAPITVAMQRSSLAWWNKHI